MNKLYVMCYLRWNILAGVYWVGKTGLGILDKVYRVEYIVWNVMGEVIAVENSE